MGRGLTIEAVQSRLVVPQSLFIMSCLLLAAAKSVATYVSDAWSCMGFLALVSNVPLLLCQLVYCMFLLCCWFNG